MDKYEIFKKAILEELEECKVDLDYFTNQIEIKIFNGSEMSLNDKEVTSCLKFRISALEKIIEISKRIDLLFYLK